MSFPMKRSPPSIASALLWLGASLCALGVTVVIANNMYWSASPTDPAGEHILFGRVMPEGLGRFLWLAIRPALPLAAAAAGWSAYRLVRAWRRRPEPGLCPACGYDLRATPARCPECGAAPAAARAPGRLA